MFFLKKKELTTKERMSLIMQHKEADRIPIIDNPWNGTIARWRKEGLPKYKSWSKYFGVDSFNPISIDISPRYPVKVIEETKDYTISTSPWGVTMKQFKKADSTPEFLDFTVTSRDEWEKAKKKMDVNSNRLNLISNKYNYIRAKREGGWISAQFWFGFDVAHSWMMGTENMLILMYEDPELVQDIYNTYLDRCIAHFDMLYDKGYRFDEITWPDDMGYKNTTFFSLDMYRNLLKPVHARAVKWAHDHGAYARLHSCGDIMTFVPDLVEIGIDALNPLEVKAGMEPLKIKKEFGDKLTLHGGINAVLWDDKEAIIAEIERVVPQLKENGGYIFSSDHSIPNSVSLDNFKTIIDTVKVVGKY